MKILNLKAENIKKLVAVDITPAGDTVIITGKNGAGKSSVLDSILFALGGKKLIDQMPIRQGQETASIRLDLGKYIVERKFTAKDSYLHVTAADGRHFGSPQDLLNDLTASITFDPLEFSRMKPREQYDTLKDLVKLDIDIEALEKQNEADFATRTDVNREVRNLAAQIGDIKAKIPEGAPTAPVDVLALANEITADKEALRKKELLETTLAQVQREIKSTEEANIALSTRHHAELEALLARHKQESETAIAKMAELIEREANGKNLIKLAVIIAPEALAEKETRLQSSQEVNRIVALRADLDAKIKAMEAAEARSKSLTETMEDRDQTKADALAKANMPIPGLSLSAGCVLFDGIPFSQASSAQQLRISIAIAMAMNPELRVIRIKDGSLLDPEGMEMLKAMASDKDFQIWIERVADNDPVAIVIEDGQVQPTEPVSAAAA